MANQTTHMRNLAASDPNTSMDPTHKRHPKSTTTVTTTSSTAKPHPTNPDPTVPSSTVQNISNHFSKLYTNHKALAFLKPSRSDHPQPHIDTHFQAKAMASSRIVEASSTSKIKPSRQRRRIVKEKKPPKEIHELVHSQAEELEKFSEKERVKKEFDEGCEVKGSSFSLVMGGGRRSSFCSSQTELADFLSCSGVKVVSADMPPFMQIHAVGFARKACDSMEKFTAMTLASTLKKEFDGVYGPAWHCIVGTSFGSFVTHSVGGFLYFSMDHKIYVLLFKTTVQRAD
ncbi:hypothetical protein RJ639_036623 [Escallonia herrerae]|uniref:Dynein light chain n=1 Tax=Escallonia herrerae TaxID=1293975 RepID=A0AA88WQ61_9ASTE|nr:hypothetical protein RJ639_036623 [Escallonia herrerae]